jgi:hypothetical protein
MYEVCPKCDSIVRVLDDLQVLAAMIAGRKIIKMAAVKGGPEEEVMVAVNICPGCEVVRRGQMRLQRKIHEAEIRKQRIYKRAAAVMHPNGPKRVNCHGR